MRMKPLYHDSSVFQHFYYSKFIIKSEFEFVPVFVVRSIRYMARRLHVKVIDYMYMLLTVMVCSEYSRCLAHCVATTVQLVYYKSVKKLLWSPVSFTSWRQFLSLV